MAINPETQYPGKVEPATPANPFGTARNITTPGDGTGTPWESAIQKDNWAFQHAMLLNAGMEPNGTPDVADNSQLFKAAKASIGNGANLLSNHNFLIASPDDSQPPPDATPRSYPPGFQIFSGVFANETTGITDLTYIDGRVSFTAGDFYMPVSNTGAIERVTEFTASVADFDGKPRTRGVSFALVGDEYRVTVGIDALEDTSGNATPLGSVKFEQGSLATRHETESLSSRNLSDYTVIVYKASYGNSAVENMVASAKIGETSSTGVTTWVRVSTSNGDISDFEPLSSIEISDYGTDQQALEDAVTNHQGKKLTLAPFAYTFTSVPSNITGVEIDASVKQRLLWTAGVRIPTTNGINTEGKETAIVACCIRWYDTTTTPVAPGPDGWYTLFDAGEEHDPILMGPVSTSGTSSLIIDVNFDGFGLSSSQWTPSGFVVGPDETLADSGASFGASVSSTQVTIRGTYNAERSGYIFYNGTSWQFSGNAYDNPTFSNGVLTITRPANAKKAAMNFSASVVPTMRRQTAADWGSNQVHAGLFALSGDDISIIFTDNNGDRVLTPDTRLKFWLNDSGLRNPDFNFGSNPGGGTNLWMIGAFVKRDGFE